MSAVDSMGLCILFLLFLKTMQKVLDLQVQQQNLM